MKNADSGTLEKYLNAGMLDLIDGRAPERAEELEAEFRSKGLVVVRDCFSDDGLRAIKEYLDVLGTDVELPNPVKSEQEKVQDAYDQHIHDSEFVRALQDDRRFPGFLERFTPHPPITTWKASVAIRFKKDAPTPPWHFDGPSVSVVIPIDAPAPGAGGGFGYFPMLRRHGEPAWLRTLKKITTRAGLHHLYRKQNVAPYEAGSMIIFDGDTTYHRALALRQQALRRSLLVTFATAKRTGTESMMM